MKIKTFTLLFLSLFIYSENLTGQDYVNYKDSNWFDLSFEAKAQLHKPEVDALDNVFTSVGGKGLYSAYEPILFAFYQSAVAEKVYLDLVGYNCEQIRLCPKQLAKLTPADLSAYNTMLAHITSNYTFSEKDLGDILSEITTIKPLSSTGLNIAGGLLEEYLMLANDLGYTKLEMFRDFTGYCSPVNYLSDMANENNYPLTFTRTFQGLGLTEAIQRLEDIQGCNGFSTIKKSDLSSTPINIEKTPTLKVFSGFPNPSTHSFTFEYHFTKESVGSQILIYNASGSIVRSLPIPDYVEGTGQLFWDGNNLSGSKVERGVYYGVMMTDEGIVADTSIKIIMR